jgi:hypothetical protein
MKRKLKNKIVRPGLDRPGVFIPRHDRGAAPAAYIPSRWVAFASWKNYGPDPITMFQATWTVPPAPAGNPPSSFFLFNGLQVTDPTEPANPANQIVQPVLQWDGTSGGWSVELWAAGVPGAGGTPQQQKPINAGAVLTGRITNTNVGSYQCDFFIGNPPGAAALATYTFTGLPLMTSCVIVLEAVNVSQSSDYPYGPGDRIPVVFSNIVVQTGAGNVVAPHWVVQAIPTPGIGENCGSPPNGNINIGFRS